MKIRFLLPSFLAAGCLALTGCNYDSPLTAKPTQMINEKLLGEWVSVD